VAGVAEVLTCGGSEVDLGEGFLMQDDLDGVGDTSTMSWMSKPMT
jgi:hypothetical protein